MVSRSYSSFVLLPPPPVPPPPLPPLKIYFELISSTGFLWECVYLSCMDSAVKRDTGEKAFTTYLIPDATLYDSFLISFPLPSFPSPTLSLLTSFYSSQSARALSEEAKYPIVMKLAAEPYNVKMISVKQLVHTV